ncbi:polyadenylate-binding protein RBP47-like [Lotus japonicus]|uniref:polyadenylate-binding protein RBP47-like n=1 Tax=Lotus japonicus TaxID=34305 RepID=UPI002589F4EF|nr:polyadenylate-binding protein RBP47-like [Lotus japonicus]
MCSPFSLEASGASQEASGASQGANLQATSRGKESWRIDLRAETSKANLTRPVAGTQEKTVRKRTKVKIHEKKQSLPLKRVVLPEEDLQRTLFVDGLDDNMTYNIIKETFSKIGRTAGVFVQRGKKMHRRSKFGFVRFMTKADAQKAIQSLNGTMPKNASLSC